MSRALSSVLVAFALVVVGPAPVGGTVTPGPGDFDPRFSGNGLVLLPTGHDLRVAALGGGSLVSVAPYGGWSVTKLTARGAPDPAFAGDGTALFDLPFLLGPEIAVTHGGGVIGAGIHYNRDVPRSFIRIVRISAVGRRLLSFGRQGVVRLDPFPHFSEMVTGVVVQPSGRIVVAGYFQDGPHLRGTSPFLLGITPSGELDPAFGDGGLVVPTFARHSQVVGLGMTTTGRLVGVGVAYPGPVTVVARWRVNGSIDRSFGDRGIAQFPDDYWAYALAMAPGDETLVAVYRPTFGEEGIFRLTDDGIVDPSFGDGGVAMLPGREARGLAVQADGSTLAATSSDESDEDVLITRIDADGLVDPSFGLDGTTRIVRDGDDAPYAAALDRAGRLLVAGYTDGPSDRMAFVARILT